MVTVYPFWKSGRAGQRDQNVAKQGERLSNKKKELDKSSRLHSSVSKKSGIFKGAVVVDIRASQSHISNGGKKHFFSDMSFPSMAVTVGEFFSSVLTRQQES